MNDLISRQAAIDALMVAVDDVGVLDGNDIKAVFDNLPSAESRKKGKWILINDNRGQHFECDKCGEWRYYQGQNFCSHCGADMREGEEE